MSSSMAIFFMGELLSAVTSSVLFCRSNFFSLEFRVLNQHPYLRLPVLGLLPAPTLLIQKGPPIPPRHQRLPYNPRQTFLQRKRLNQKLNEVPSSRKRML